MWYKVENNKNDVLPKKSPDGRYSLDIYDGGEAYYGRRVCRIKLENRLSKDIRIFDFAYVPHSRRKELYWGACSLLFSFFSFDKSSLKMFLVICDISNRRYARLDVGNSFLVLTRVLPMLRERIVASKVKSNLSGLTWTDYN